MTARPWAIIPKGGSAYAQSMRPGGVDAMLDLIRLITR